MKKFKFKLNIVGGIPKRNFLSSILPVVFISLIFNLFTKPLSAQNVGINSTAALPKSSAILDLSTGNAGNLGFLVPKVGLDSTVDGTTPVASPSNGLLVYDTVTAGKTPHDVTEGFYYWNSTSSTWVRLGDHLTYSAIGTTDDSINSSTFKPITGMSYTCTPVHSVIILEFSASGLTNLSQNNLEAVDFEVLINGSTPNVTTTTTPYILGGYGCTTVAQGNYSSSDPVKGWDCHMTIPIHVTPGVSVTISIDWRARVGTVGTYSIVENDVATKSEGCHRAITITD